MNSTSNRSELKAEASIVCEDLNPATVQRNRLRAATSFMISLWFHVTIMLLFSGVWVIGSQVNPIRLEANADREIDLDHVSFQVEVPKIEAPLESEVEQLPDVVFQEQATLDPFQPSTAELVSFDSNDMSMLTERPKATGAHRSTGGSFFGIPSTGDRIVYIIDRSPSMQVGKYQTRYMRAVTELMASVNRLREDQEFHVIMFSFKTVKLRVGRNRGFTFATEENKELLKKRLNSMDLSPGTDPRESIVAALRLEPTCIFLLTDGEFNGEFNRNGTYKDKIDSLGLVKKHNKSKIPIHTIGLEDPRTQEQLSRIAEFSGGSYVFVPAED